MFHYLCCFVDSAFATVLYRLKALPSSACRLMLLLHLHLTLLPGYLPTCCICLSAYLPTKPTCFLSIYQIHPTSLHPYRTEQAIKAKPHHTTHIYAHPPRVSCSLTLKRGRITTSTSTSILRHPFWLFLFITVSASGSLLISRLPPRLPLRLRSWSGGLRRFTCIQHTAVS
ncbi:hypothetical protein F5B21DRAFT_16594 [Xylaria acuta]|nr:hypothetical protein F5B21DRAFT_16594 [Xylaria acuta]